MECIGIQSKNSFIAFVFFYTNRVSHIGFAFEFITNSGKSFNHDLWPHWKLENERNESVTM